MLYHPQSSGMFKRANRTQKIKVTKQLFSTAGKD
uniref:Uncharacterized protein n=1 Tax=Anguilla anguilla TaxID=7936 RepID=A0A0E9UV65_ANGAN